MYHVIPALPGWSVASPDGDELLTEPILGWMITIQPPKNEDDNAAAWPEPITIGGYGIEARFIIGPTGQCWDRITDCLYDNTAALLAALKRDRATSPVHPV